MPGLPAPAQKVSGGRRVKASHGHHHKDHKEEHGITVQSSVVAGLSGTPPILKMAEDGVGEKRKIREMPPRAAKANPITYFPEPKKRQDKQVKGVRKDEQSVGREQPRKFN
eukprot:CAMPEP_0170745750 /NCGR_PEP_ID=MMETSP0437-20130122/8453_1 /TAXON_ID=0 /ORGANISM="Sexangularia sp." /LENGTH=110 /DNA_ID=CAMNT_0011084477 /DNA_START=18 /DNA_END=350 /DNA_ORIENTATION=-